MKFGMVVAIIIGFSLCLKLVKNIIECIKNKKYLPLLMETLTIPFIVFMFSALALGGSAFNNAPTEYALYQAGHYYLESHNKYIEVTQGQYVYMQIIQIVGISAFIVHLILSLIKSFQAKMKTEG